MSISAIQQASKEIRDFENEVLEGQASHAWNLYDALVRLRAESLELFNAAAMMMFDEEIGKRAREIAAQAKKGTLSPVAASFAKEEGEGGS